MKSDQNQYSNSCYNLIRLFCRSTGFENIEHQIEKSTNVNKLVVAYMYNILCMDCFCK